MVRSGASIGGAAKSRYSRAARRLSSILMAAIALCGCVGKPEGVVPIRPFAIDRYLGEWFEIARLDHSFERGLTNVTATYTLRDDGSVGVLNRGFDRKTCKWKDADGRAVFQGAKDIASLSVTFFWPFAGGYHVFDLDQVDYGWALVSGPSRNYLWILARRPDLSPEIRNRLVEKARSYPTKQADALIADRNYQDLDQLVIEHLLGR